MTQIEKMLQRGLEARGGPAQCPGCNKRIYSPKQCGGIGFHVDNDQHIILSYVMCPGCYKNARKVDQRIDRRLTKNASAYLFPLIQIEGAITSVFRSAGPGQDDDREWFEKNPTRTHRLRPFIAGEGPLWPVAPTHVLVRQLCPERRMRIGWNAAVAVHPAELERLRHSDDELFLLFEALNAPRA